MAKPAQTNAMIVVGGLMLGMGLYITDAMEKSRMASKNATDLMNFFTVLGAVLLCWGGYQWARNRKRSSGIS